jgi:hypothetical protein
MADDRIAQAQALSRLQAPMVENAQMGSQTPQIPMPLRPLVTTARGDRESALEQQLAPKTGSPHGFWQNVRHVAATIGNVAGDVFAPATMALIPGTQLHNDIEHSNQSRELAGLQSEDREDSTTAAENSQRQAQTANVESETRARDNPAPPSDAWTIDNTYEGPNGEPVEINKTTGQTRIAPSAFGIKRVDTTKPVNMEHVAGMVNGKPVEANYHPDTGKFTDTAGNEIQNFQPTPPITPAGAIVLNPSTQGGYDAQAVRPGAHIAPGAVSVAGMNSLDTPTAQTRNMAEMAKTVLPQMTAISNEVDQMASAIGPAVGRWNQLMTNKGGADFPAFAKLDTDLDLLASAIVRTHFGARGGQQYREELRKQLGEAQSPEDLKARIAGANSWLQGYAHMADPAGQGGATATTPPPGAKVIKWNDVK